MKSARYELIMKAPTTITTLPRHPHRGYQRYREWIQERHPWLQIANKILIAIAGVVVIAVGIVLIPLPGPGWLIVFFGLSILGLEFPPIQRFTRWILDRLKPLWRAVQRRLPARFSRSRVVQPSEPR